MLLLSSVGASVLREITGVEGFSVPGSECVGSLQSGAICRPIDLEDVRDSQLLPVGGRHSSDVVNVAESEANNTIDRIAIVAMWGGVPRARSGRPE